MPNGYQALGEALGGGTAPLRQNAFMQGQLAQANVGHLSAQTQEALSQAKLNQMNATKLESQQTEQENLADALLKALPNATPEQAHAYATIIRSGSANFEQATQGRGNLQTQGFRDTLADPNADPAKRLAAASGIQGKPESPYVSVPQESVNAFDPGIATGAAPTVHDTPLADAIIGQHKAAADLATAQATNPQLFHPKSGDGGPKAPSGYEFGADGKTLQPIKGGPHDPANATMGSRESTYFQRMVGSANQAIGDIQNVVQLPVGSSTGVFGIGSSPGKSILASTKDTLRNALSSNEVKDYNSILPGLDRNLASIETAGLVPSGTFAESFSALALREGEDQISKLGKLAQMRQIIEKGLEPSLANGRISPDQKAFVQKMIDDIKSAIPFTRNDIIKLRAAQEKNPSATLNDVIKRNNLGTAPPSFGTEAEAEAAGLAPGTKVVIGGVSGTWH